ncbi:MAG: methyltransferase [Deltaproteobacteria bacterium]|nr:methyltransferase [Deltaproteobacteria bacterium]
MTTLRATLLGHELAFRTDRGLFSHDRVDDGTLLLLDHLPAGRPTSVLDVGCGWGALGIPVARAHPAARVHLVDRDLLAVDWAALNARANACTGVTCAGSLGYRDVAPGHWDWILCNVPARIGAEAIGYLLGAGAARLAPGGQLRVVVITDLAAVVEAQGRARGWALRRVVDGPRHVVFALDPTPGDWPDHETLYRLDAVRVDAGGTPLALDRPHDFNEDPAHLRDAVPLLLECLPRTGAGAAWCVRAGYGAAAIVLAQRGFRVTVMDRDMMATTYSRRNAGAHGVDLAVRDTLHPEDALAEGPAPQLVVGEVHPQEPRDEAAARLAASRGWLAPGGRVLWLLRDKAARDAPAGGTVLARRGAYILWQAGAVAPPKARRR